MTNAERWQSFLVFLDGGRGDIGRSYELARRYLANFFRMKGVLERDVDELVDETLDRVMGKFQQEGEIHNCDGYLRTFARYIFLEHIKHDRYRERRLGKVKSTPPEDDEPEPDVELIGRLRALCSDEDVAVVSSYYEIGFGSYDYAGRRQQLAQRLGVRLSTLRAVVMRARRRLRRKLVG